MCCTVNPACLALELDVLIIMIMTMGKFRARKTPLLLIGAIGASIILLYLYFDGMFTPFCRMRTNVIEEVKILPPTEELINYYQNNGWSIKLSGFEKKPKSLPHKDSLLEMKINKKTILWKPEVTVYFFEMKEKADVDYEGQIQIYIEYGSRIINKFIYTNFIRDINKHFSTNIEGGGFNYMSYCS